MFRNATVGDWAEVATAVITFLILRALWVHAELFGRQADALDLSVQDAAKANRDSTDSRQKEQRAYLSTFEKISIYVTHDDFEMMAGGGAHVLSRKVIVTIGLVNSGRTPARKIFATVRLKRGKGDTSADPIELAVKSLPDIGDGHDRKLRLEWKKLPPDSINYEGYNTIEGMVEYWDVFGLKRETPISYTINFEITPNGLTHGLSWFDNGKNPT